VIPPVPPDEVHTTTRLGKALREVPDPGAVPASMIQRAEAGYYHDYLSPLALPELALVAELRSLANHPSRAGLPSRRVLARIIDQVINGVFDASKAESDAWARSAEGQAAMRDLLGDGGPLTDPRVFRRGS
jgi:hypothetical protein